MTNDQIEAAGGGEQLTGVPAWAVTLLTLEHQWNRWSDDIDPSESQFNYGYRQALVQCALALKASVKEWLT